MRVVPGLDVNLLSWGSLVAEGSTFKQQQDDGSGHSVLFTSPGGTESFVARLTPQNIYVLETIDHLKGLLAFAFPYNHEDAQPDAITLAVQDVVDTLLAPSHRPQPARIHEDTMKNWHRRWAHMNHSFISQLASDPRRSKAPIC